MCSRAVAGASSSDIRWPLRATGYRTAGYGAACMSPAASTDRPAQTYGFLLVPQFSMISFSALLEPLRIANWVAGRTLYRWQLFGRDDAPVVASNGLPLAPTAPWAAIAQVDVLFVVAGDDVHLHCDAATVALLRRLARRGMDLGATSTGSLLLAHAGALDGYRCTIHWENLTGLREAFPRVRASSELFQIDRNRLTCSGGVAGLDMVLHLVARRHGRKLAHAVSEQCLYGRIRPAEVRQRTGLRQRLGVSHAGLLAVVARMEAELEEPVAPGALAQACGLSPRQLERLFREHLGTTPARYHLQLRLARAQALLQQTSLPVVEVGVACGFASASHFARCYRQRYDRTPRQERAPQ